LLLALATPTTAKSAAPNRPALVDWTPLPVFVGAPILFKTTACADSATWLDTNIEFRSEPHVTLWCNASELVTQFCRSGSIAPLENSHFCHRLLAESHLTRRLFGSMVRRTDALPVATAQQEG
jgi:hypothetical protein